jgi:hypothetical protein
MIVRYYQELILTRSKKEIPKSKINSFNKPFDRIVRFLIDAIDYY